MLELHMRLNERRHLLFLWLRHDLGQLGCSDEDVPLSLFAGTHPPEGSGSLATDECCCWSGTRRHWCCRRGCWADRAGLRPVVAAAESSAALLDDSQLLFWQFLLHRRLQHKTQSLDGFPHIWLRLQVILCSLGLNFSPVDRGSWWIRNLT